ncbi:hypothetical protein V9K67_23095 [Paraflavisolibacter sp. H34]|uniref:hypothetical protein n=1 Tax=Huijunlia imazamoxiresistens TaxID=3127457 RepID=UPI003019C7F1
MKRSLAVPVALLLLLTACERDNEADDIITDPVSPVIYTARFPDSVFHYQHKPVLDIDHDGRFDFSSGTEIAGSREGDRWKYYLNPAPGWTILLDANENPVPLDKGVVIGEDPGSGRSWSLSNALLVEKWNRLDGSTHRSGAWYTPHRQYMAVRLKKDDRYYYGWIELGYQPKADEPSDQFIYRTAAVARTSGRPVKAGEAQ